MGFRRIATTLVLSGLGLALGSQAQAQPSDTAFGPTVTVAPLRGKGGADCSQKLGRWLDEQVPIEPWHGGAAVGGFQTFEALSQFVERKGRALGAQIVVVGTARSNKLVLEAYAVKSGALLHLARIPIPKAAGHCRLGRRGRTQLSKFVAQAVRAFRRRVVVAARRAAAAASLEAVAAVPTATVAAAAVPVPDPVPAPAEPAVKTSSPAIALSDLFGSGDVLRDDSRRSPRRRRRGPADVGLAFESTWVEIEPQFGLAQRNFTFKSGGSVARSYLVGALFTPGFRVQLRPYIKTPGLFARLSLDLNYQQSPNYRSRRYARGPLVNSGYSEFQALLHYPIAWSGVDLGPQVGFHSLGYRLRGTAAGAVGEDTPSVDYRSLVAGLRMGALLGRTAEIRASASYLPVLASGEVFSSKYYPNGSAWGLHLQAGVTVRVHKFLDVVVAGHFTAYSLDLGTEAGDAEQVTDATDRSSGLRLGLRLGF